VVEHSRGQIGHIVVDALNAARNADTIEARHEAVDKLCEVTSDIVAAFPMAERLLVVPLGICSLLPYSAAHQERECLIERTAITLAPSMAWARAAHRSRSGGPNVAAFHPGRPPQEPLSLTQDRRTFENLVGGKILDRPTAGELLDSLVSDAGIAQLSCHGAYNTLIPLESRLELETDLTIQAVLDHKAAPWLVNLSACETGIPDLQAAEQLISFPTGFILGGAAHVIATLWPVRNDHATAINHDFYELLNSGTHPAEALRRAVQSLRRVPATTDSPRRSDRRSLMPATEQPDEVDTHPDSWAPFVHYGSPW
jgi:CHAT domain-containing protein